MSTGGNCNVRQIAIDTTRMCDVQHKCLKHLACIKPKTLN